MIFLFANFVDTVLAAELDQAATVAAIPQSASELYPQPTGEEALAITIQDGYQAPEIVYIRSNPRTGLVTIERGKEGTAAKTWQAGSLFIHTLTKESILWFSTGGASALIEGLQDQIDTLTSQLSAANAEIDALREYVDSKDGDLHDELEAASASISSVATTIADTNYALSELETTLTAQVSSNAATISIVATTVADNQSAQSEFNLALSADINGVASNLTSYQSAQSSINEALTLSVDTLTASYGDQQAQITTTAMALSTIEGNLSGSYVINISAGQFASLELAAGSGTASYSYFALRVQDFYISDPTGQYNPFRFDVGAGIAYLQNAYIQNAWVENLTLQNTKIGYNQITDRITISLNSTIAISDTVRTELVAFYYGTAGGALEITASLTVEATSAGDTYPQLFITQNGSDVLGVPWYIKGNTFDSREFSVDLEPPAGLYRFAVEAQLAPGSGGANARRERLKVQEFLR